MENSFKVCSICKENKSTTEFNKKLSSKDGLQNVCRLCNSEQNKKHYQNNLDKIKNRSKKRNRRVKPELQKILLPFLEKGCAVCGEKDLVVLDFDHLRDKKYNIAKLVSAVFSVKKVLSEIEKCQILCANCHRRKTAKDFNWWRINIAE